MIPGEKHFADGPLELNAGRDKLELVAVNTGDRPIQIGSHLHMPNANSALEFDREAAEGYRLDIPSGTSVRFEPGVSRTLPLVRLAGRRYVPSAHVEGHVDHPEPTRKPRSVVPFGTPKDGGES